jgi:hypothetical protein
MNLRHGEEVHDLAVIGPYRMSYSLLNPGEGAYEGGHTG